MATYAAISIERVLTVRQPAESVALGSSQSKSKQASLLEPTDLQPFLQGIFRCVLISIVRAAKQYSTLYHNTGTKGEMS